MHLKGVPQDPQGVPHTLPQPPEGGGKVPPQGATLTDEEVGLLAQQPGDLPEREVGSH